MSRLCQQLASSKGAQILRITQRFFERSWLKKKTKESLASSKGAQILRITQRFFERSWLKKKTKESLASSKGAQILRITQRSWLKKSKEILGNQIWIEYKPEVQAGFRASFGSFGPVWLH